MAFPFFQCSCDQPLFGCARYGKKLVVAMGVCASVATLFGSGQAFAQSLESTEGSAIGAQATFNNNWAQTFEVTGPLGDTGTIKPFSSVSSSHLSLPDAGLASLQAEVRKLSQVGGVLEATGDVTADSTSTGLLLNLDAHDGVPSIKLTPDPAVTDSTIGASVIGTSIGVESLQVTGSSTNTVINQLSAF